MTQSTASTASETPTLGAPSAGALILAVLLLLLIPASYILGLDVELQQWLGSQIELERAWVLHWFWAIPALAIFTHQWRRRQQQQLRHFASARLLPQLTESYSIERKRIKTLFFVLAWSFFLIAWSGPRWGTKIRILKRAGIDVVVAVDVSESMLAKDIPTASPTRKQRRLALARRKVRYLIEQLKGERIGMLAFSGQPVMLCPLTIDYNTCAVWLDAFEPRLIPSSGTALASTIRKAIPMFSTSGQNSRALILITDGDDHQKDTEAAAKEAKKRGIRIYTLGLGSTTETTIDPSDLPPPPKGEPEDPRPIKTRLNAKLLQRVSGITQGLYRHAELSSRDIRSLYQHARKTLVARANKSQRKVYREARFPWFLGLGLFFLLLEFGFRERRSS